MSCIVKQMTVRNVSEELSKRLERLSDTRGESVNTTVLRLLEQAVGIDGRRERLARYVTWSAADRQEMDDALRAQRSVDPELWKE